jgi:hypothetical protein
MSGWKAGAKEGKQASKQEGSVLARKLGYKQLMKCCSMYSVIIINSDKSLISNESMGGTPNRYGLLVTSVVDSGLNYN